MSRPPIGMADALTAAAILGIHDQAGVQAVTALLGLRATQALPPSDHAPAQSAPASAQVQHVPAPSKPPAWTGPAPHRSAVTVLEIASDPAPVQIDVPETILRAHDQPTPELPYEPPLSPSRIRPAVTALLARPRRSTRPDLPRLIRAVARCSPLRCIPYEHERSLSQGVTVVADIGPAMIPYLADVDFLLEQIQNTVGMSSTAVRWIDDDPVPLELPRERPVLVITSLGTRRKARWLRALPAEVVALVPQRGMGLPGAALTVAWDDLPKVVRRHG